MGIAKIMTVSKLFPEHSPSLPLAGQIDSLATNTCHWLSQCCSVGMVNKQRNVLIAPQCFWSNRPTNGLFILCILDWDRRMFINAENYNTIHL